jgi:hypothetical protein
MKQRFISILVLCLLSIWLAACGVPTQNVPHVASDNDVPAGLLETSTSTTSTVPALTPLITVSICLAQRAGPLKAVSRQITSEPTVNNILRALATRPTSQEEFFGLETAAPGDITGTVQGGIAKISLGSDFAADSAANQLTAVDQIVCTLTARPGIGQVQFFMNGAHIDIPRDDGSTTASPVSRDDYPELMPPTSS